MADRFVDVKHNSLISTGVRMHAHPHSCSRTDVLERHTLSDNTRAHLEVLKKRQVKRAT